MGKPITTAADGICFAFPDVCKTPAPPSPSPVPIPYPNVGTLSAAQMSNLSDTVFAQSNRVVRSDSEIPNSTGDQAGSADGVKSGSVGGSVTFTSASQSVFCDGGKGVVRMFDSTQQNGDNAVGVVLAGVPSVLVGD